MLAPLLLAAGLASAAPWTVLMDEQAAEALGARRIEAQVFGGWDTEPVKEEIGFLSTSPEILRRALAGLGSVPVVRQETLTVPAMRPHPGRRWPPIRSLSLDLATGVVSDE